MARKERRLSRTEPGWIASMRNEAREIYQKQEMPQFKYGIGIFAQAADLAPFIEKAELGEEAGGDIISHDRSIKVQGLAEATHPEIKDILADPNKGKFASLNRAFFNKATVITAPKNTTGAVRIESHLKKTRIDNLIIIAEEGSRLTVIETAAAEAPLLRSHQVQIVGKAGSQIRFISSQTFSEEAYHFSDRNASLGKDAKITWLDFCFGSKFSQVNIITTLEGEGAGCRNWGAYFGTNSQNFDINGKTIHNASHSHSDMLVKRVLDKKAKAIYRGLIKIPLNSIGCRGYQKDETLLLSKDAEADSIPNLEISNNEVKCSHGAAISNVHPEQVFYMTSRGMSEEEAKNMLVRGFLQSVIDEIKDEKTEDALRENIIRKMRK